MKRILWACIFVFYGTLSVFSEDDIFFAISDFKGLNTASPSIFIGDNEAQDLLNVDFDNGVLVKRDGYANIASSVLADKVSGLFTYTNSAGINQLILCSGSTVAYSVGTNSWTNLITTMTTGAFYDAVQAGDKMYMVNDVNFVQQYNGTALTSASSIPIGRYVEHHDNRLWVAISSAVYFSETLVYTQFDVAASSGNAGLIYVRPFDGQEVRGMKSYRGSLIVCKDESTYRISGQGPPNDIHEIALVSDEYGCVSNWSMVEYNGLLFWAARQGLVVFDGSTIQLASRKITPTWEGFSTGNPRTISLTDTTEGDFDSGSSTGIINNISLTAESGSIRGTWPDPFDVLRATETTEGVWTRGTESSPSGQHSWEIANGQFKLSFTQTTGLENIFLRTDSTVRQFDDTLNYSIYLKNTDTRNDGSWISLLLSPTAISTGRPRADLTDYISVQLIKTSGGTYQVNLEQRVAGTRSSAYTSSTSSDDDAIVTLTLDGSPKTMVLAIDGTTVYNGTHTTTFTAPYVYLEHYPNGSSAGAVRQGIFDNFSVAKGTGSFVSRALDTGVTSPSWRRFSPAETLSVGTTITYYTQVSSDNSTWDSAVKVNAGDIITSSSKRYIRYRADLLNNVAYNSTDTFKVSEVNIGYATTSDPSIMTAIVNEEKILMAARTVGSATNNRVLTFHIDRGFSMYDWKVNYFTRYSGLLYHGNSENADVHDHSGSSNDNGSNFDAYWKSKDFSISAPFSNKTFDRGYLIAKGEANAYDLDLIPTAVTDSSVSTATNVVSLQSTNPFVTRFFRIPYDRYGKYINVELFNNDLNEEFSVYGVGIYGKTLTIP